MVDLIDKAYADRITLKTVSAALRGKPAFLGRVFHDAVGLSVHEYVTRVRLERAAHLIASNVKVEAVSLTVGYRSKKNFYRQFTRHFGVTPENYRRRPVSLEGRQMSRGGGWGSQDPKQGIATFSATFNQTICRIDIETRQNLKGRPSFIATPYVVVKHDIQPFAAITDHVELIGDSEADAVEHAVVFLEHQFGTRTQGPKRHRDERRQSKARTSRR
jgi:AraC-like DNA-binding protein